MSDSYTPSIVADEGAAIVGVAASALCQERDRYNTAHRLASGERPCDRCYHYAATVLDAIQAANAENAQRLQSIHQIASDLLAGIPSMASDELALVAHANLSRIVGLARTK